MHTWCSWAIRLTCFASKIHVHCKSNFNFTAFCNDLFFFFPFHSCPPRHSPLIFRVTVQSLGTLLPQGGWMSLCCGQYYLMVHLGLHLEGVSVVLRFENTLFFCVLHSWLLKKLSFKKFLLYNLSHGDSWSYYIQVVEVPHYHNFCCLSIFHLIATFCSVTNNNPIL